MEIVDNAFLLLVPGAMAAGLASGLFWWSLAVALAVAFVLTVPVNRWLIGRGLGHAVVHHMHHALSRPYDLDMKRVSLVLVTPLLLAAVACAPEEDSADDTAAEPTPTAADQCDKENLPLLTHGTLTIGTDSPAFQPWFVDDDPTNGKGYESAVAYAVAEQLGFTADEVTLGEGPVQQLLQAGREELRLRHQPDLDQPRSGPRSSTSPTSYYDAAQAVVALKGSAGAEATSLADLHEPAPRRADRHHLADRDPRRDPAGTRTRSSSRAPTPPSRRCRTTRSTRSWPTCPTAFYISAVEIPNSVLVGQFQPDTGEQEEFGMLFEKGSELVPCVNEALADPEGRRHARPDRAAVALRRRGRPRAPVTGGRVAAERARARAPPAAEPRPHPLAGHRHRRDRRGVRRAPRWPSSSSPGWPTRPGDVLQLGAREGRRSRRSWRASGST